LCIHDETFQSTLLLRDEYFHQILEIAQKFMVQTRPFQFTTVKTPGKTGE
jgi:hypothetical protein